MEESEKKTKRGQSRKMLKPPKHEWKFIKGIQAGCIYNPHELVAEFNCTNDRNLEHITENPKFSMEYPCPVYVSETRPNKADPCHKRVVEHFRYNHVLSFNQAIYNSQKKRKDIKHLMKKENTYPACVLRIAELLESDPDPYFKGEYDWYFTGGNLEVINERNLVFHVAGDNLNELVASKIVHNDDQLSLNPKVIYILTSKSKKNLEIFEIKKIQTSPKIVISIRQKHAISMYQYRNEKMKCTLTFTQKKVPFISSASDLHQTEFFVSSDLEKTVVLWDINKSTSKPIQTLFKSNNSVKNENWNCVRYINPNIFALAEFDKFSLLDRRVPFNENNHVFSSLKDGTEYCEKISAINVSNNYENLLYFGTTHKVFAVDFRYLQKKFKDKYMLIKWTHQLNTSPLIINSFKQEKDYEIIIASSPISGDVRLLENFKKDDDDDTKFLSTCLPYMPPSLLDGFNQARNKGKCLNPIANLKKRIDQSITGMNFYSTRDGQLYTLTSNSIGDVFSQKFLFNDGMENLSEKNLRIMNQWEKDVLNMEKSTNCPLNVTNVENFIGIKKVFRCNRLDKIQQDDEEEIEVEPKRPQRLQKWQKSIRELKMYKDALANNILEIWDINDDLEEHKDDIKIETKIEKEKKIKRVEDWLKNAPLTPSLPPPPPPLKLASPSMVQISYSNYQDVTQNSSYAMLDDAASIKSENLNYSQTQVQQVKEVKKLAKRSFVQGF